MPRKNSGWPFPMFSRAVGILNCGINPKAVSQASSPISSPHRLSFPPRIVSPKPFWRTD